MDLDLHRRADRSHLDDPAPPDFGSVWAGGAARRAADTRVRRARVAAASFLAVSLLLGLGAVAASRSPNRMLQAADTSTSVAQAPLIDTAVVPTTVGQASVTVPDTLTTASPPPPAPGAPSTTARPGPAGGAAPGPPLPLLPPPEVPVTSPAPPHAATGEAPIGSVPAPQWYRFTLTLHEPQVAAGGSVRATVRFENPGNYGLIVLLDKCTTFTAGLYEAGRRFGPQGGCGPHFDKIPGFTTEEAEVVIEVPPTYQAGTYDVFSTMFLQEHVNGEVHTEPAVLTVVQPVAGT